MGFVRLLDLDDLIIILPISLPTMGVENNDIPRIFLLLCTMVLTGGCVPTKVATVPMRFFGGRLSSPSYQGLATRFMMASTRQLRQSTMCRFSCVAARLGTLWGQICGKLMFICFDNQHLRGGSHDNRNYLHVGICRSWLFYFKLRTR